MTAPISTSVSGLAAAMIRLNEAARKVAGASTPATPQWDGAPVTGATGAPTGTMDDPAAALLDLMAAELQFRANVEVFKTSADMVRSLYEIFD